MGGYTYANPSLLYHPCSCIKKSQHNILLNLQMQGTKGSMYNLMETSVHLQQIATLTWVDIHMLRIVVIPALVICIPHLVLAHKRANMMFLLILQMKWTKEFIYVWSTIFTYMATCIRMGYTCMENSSPFLSVFLIESSLQFNITRISRIHYWEIFLKRSRLEMVINAASPFQKSSKTETRVKKYIMK